MKLYKRKILARIQKLIGKEKGLVLQGARRVGKTAILQYLQDGLNRQGKRTVYYDLAYPDVLANLSRGAPALTADLTSKGYANEEVYVLIDDLQQLKQRDLFLGSILELNKNIHLIAASAVRVKPPPPLKVLEVSALSFSEFLEFKALESAQVGQWPEVYQEFIQYGGYPEVVLEPLIEKKKQLLWQMVDIYLRKDVGDLARVKDMVKFNRLLSVLAGQTGQVTDMMALVRETGISFPTLKKYLQVLEQTFLVERVMPYSRHPGTEISKSPKLFFLDSGLQSILWLNHFQPTILEPVFKTNIFGELVKKVGREAVKFWRTKAGAEVDFIVQKSNGAILAIEAATNFQRFNPKNISYFKRRYNPKYWRVIGLEGVKLPRNGFYPWEM